MPVEKSWASAIFGISDIGDKDQAASRLIHPTSPFAVVWLIATCESAAHVLTLTLNSYYAKIHAHTHTHAIKHAHTRQRTQLLYAS